MLSNFFELTIMEFPRNRLSVCKNILAALAIGLIMAGCAAPNSTVDSLGQPVIFVKSLSEKVSERFPISEWENTKTTLYDPEIELSDETGGIWVRVKGQTWLWMDERRYRYSVDMLTVPEINTSENIVTLQPSREIMWDLGDIPRKYKQQVMDMTYPMLMDVFHDQGFSGVLFERRPQFHE